MQSEPSTPDREASGSSGAGQPNQAASDADSKAAAGDKQPTGQEGTGAAGYASSGYPSTPGSFAGWPGGSADKANAGASGAPSAPPQADRAGARGSAPAGASSTEAGEGSAPGADEKQPADSKPGSGEDATSTPAASSTPPAASSTTSAESSSAQSSPTAPPPAGADPTTALPVMGGAQRGAASGGSSVQRADVTQAITPVKGGPPVEPGEESPDSAALATVSKLSDEVLVVDEHPRFHLAGCQTIAGNDTIPLPVKEAIEYGFSPCATCSPVRVLAGRNRAASSS